MLKKLLFVFSFLFCAQDSICRNDPIQSTFISPTSEDNYNCIKGKTSDYRLLLISPQANFMFSRIIDQPSSRSPIENGAKMLPYLATITGFIKGSERCLTVIETPQSFNQLEVIDTVDEISRRCFAKIFIMVSVENSSSPLSERETDMLVSTIKLMDSLYVESIWDMIEVVFWEEQNNGNISQNYKNWFIEHVEIPANGKVKEDLAYMTINSDKEFILLQKLRDFQSVDSNLEQNDPNFFTKSGIPWIGNPGLVEVNQNLFTKIIDGFVLVENFNKNKFSVLKDGEVEKRVTLNVIKRRNDLFQVRIEISNLLGTFAIEYNETKSINSVLIHYNEGIAEWTTWSSWTKCSNISERVSRTRQRLTTTSRDESESESRPCYCADLFEYPKPRILMIGKTGVGKSSLGNQLLGGYKAFASGHEVESKTEEISVFSGNFLGVGNCFTIIDTPGAKDTKGRDYKHTMAMQKLLKKKIKSFEVILLLTAGTNPRVDGSTIELLRWYEAVFGSDMWKHVIIEVTFWPHKKSDIQSRNKIRKTNENKYANDIKKKIKEEMKIGNKIKIPVTFIDPVFGIFEDPCLEDHNRIEPLERQKFKMYISHLQSDIAKIPEFNCKERCLAPDEFFSGGPFVSIPSDRILYMKQGDSKVIEWQIWTGITTNYTTSYDVTVNNVTIFKKSEEGIDRLDSMGEIEGFNGFEANLDESNKIPKVTSIKLNLGLQKKSSPMLSFTIDLLNEVRSPSSVQILVVKDAELNQWSTWSPCSISCMEERNQQPGQQVRTRTCKQQENGGKSCGDLLNIPNLPLNQDVIENTTRICSGNDENTFLLCPIDLKWSQWTEWGNCSANCGPGTRTRVHYCTNGRHGGTMCTEHRETEVDECFIKTECPINCMLSDWSEWSGCSLTCNLHNSTTTAFSIRKRSKNVLQDSNDEGLSCGDMSSSETEICEVPMCPINGIWSNYTEFSDCSTTCGQGWQSALRYCLKPSYNGSDCIGDQKNAITCKKVDCPVDCKYGKWSSWSSCSKSCDVGEMRRSRNLTLPMYGGRACEESSEETRECMISQCPPDKYLLEELKFVITDEYDAGSDASIYVALNFGNKFCTTNMLDSPGNSWARNSDEIFRIDDPHDYFGRCTGFSVKRDLMKLKMKFIMSGDNLKLDYASAKFLSSEGKTKVFAATNLGWTQILPGQNHRLEVSLIHQD